MPRAKKAGAAAGQGEPSIPGPRGEILPDMQVRESTGRGAREWFWLLDRWGAAERTHSEIAVWLTGEHLVENWWAESLTTGYEQARGRSKPSPRTAKPSAAAPRTAKPRATAAPGVTAQAVVTGSKTVAASADAVFAAFKAAAVRKQWLPGATFNVRSSEAPGSLVADWADGSRVTVAIAGPAGGPTRVALSHDQLADAAESARLKAFWRERLAALKNLVES